MLFFTAHACMVPHYVLLSATNSIPFYSIRPHCVSDMAASVQIDVKKKYKCAFFVIRVLFGDEM